MRKLHIFERALRYLTPPSLTLERESLSSEEIDKLIALKEADTSILSLITSLLGALFAIIAVSLAGLEYIDRKNDRKRENSFSYIKMNLEPHFIDHAYKLGNMVRDIYNKKKSDGDVDVLKIIQSHNIDNSITFFLGYIELVAVCTKESFCEKKVFEAYFTDEVRILKFLCPFIEDKRQMIEHDFMRTSFEVFDVSCR